MGKAVSVPYLARVLAIVWFAAVSLMAEEFAAWSHKGEVWLDASPGGADLAGGLKAFPLLVRLTAAEFRFNEARGDGADLRFTSPEGKVLAHEIERWDAAGGRAEIWVRLDTVRAGVAGQVIRMHWGMPGAASTSNGAAVFDGTAGHQAVWHMGGTGPRPNAVAGGFPATPLGLIIPRPGIISAADSMDGGASYLNLDDGYAGYGSGFAFSAWIKPVNAGPTTHLLHLGNAGEADNIFVRLDGNGKDLAFGAWIGGGLFLIRAPNVIEDSRWQHIGLSVAGNQLSLSRNGKPWGTTTLPGPLPSVRRDRNYIGGSRWDGSFTWRGLIDEARLSATAHPPDWYRLSYETQKPDQKSVSMRLTATCLARFSVPADTSVDEGSTFDLVGIADCSQSWYWSPISGPAPRILDPEVKTLTLTAPRVQGDAEIVFRFTAETGGIAQMRDVRLRVRETIPDPAFDLPKSIAWSGRDSLPLRMVLTNTAELLAAGSPPVHSHWTLAGPEVDTTWITDGIMLAPTTATDTLRATLCLENGGPRQCRTVVVRMEAAEGLWRRYQPLFLARPPSLGRNVLGRWYPVRE